MKIRSGFVSNSSSSSFIIAIPKDIKTVGTLQDYIFGTQKTVLPEYGDACYAVSDVAHRVFEDMLKAGPRTEDQLVEDYCHGWTDEYEQAKSQVEATLGGRSLYEVHDHDEWNKYHDKVDKIHKRLATKKIKAFLKKCPPDCNFYRLVYGDENGQFEATIEHGDVFGRIPHLITSMH